MRRQTSAAALVCAVLLVHFTWPVTAWSVLAYGQTTNLDSPHSRDQIRLFANHELRPVWFSEEAIAANLARRYRPAEAGLASGYAVGR